MISFWPGLLFAICALVATAGVLLLLGICLGYIASLVEAGLLELKFRFRSFYVQWQMRGRYPPELGRRSVIDGTTRGTWKKLCDAITAELGSDVVIRPEDSLESDLHLSKEELKSVVIAVANQLNLWYPKLWQFINEGQVVTVGDLFRLLESEVSRSKFA